VVTEYGDMILKGYQDIECDTHGEWHGKGAAIECQRLFVCVITCPGHNFTPFLPSWIRSGRTQKERVIINRHLKKSRPRINQPIRVSPTETD
jgi:hypothetical protein